MIRHARQGPLIFSLTPSIPRSHTFINLGMMELTPDVLPMPMPMSEALELRKQKCEWLFRLLMAGRDGMRN